jgi:DNA-3-methyladenine glycosylase II
VNRTAEFEIEPQTPYSLIHTGARLHDYSEAVDRFDGETYRRLVFIERSPVLVQVSQLGPPARARLLARLEGRTAHSEQAHPKISALLARVLGTRTNVRPFYNRFRKDPLLGPIIGSFQGLRVAGRSTAWEALIQMVVSQQIHLHLAHGILSDLSFSFGRRAKFRGELHATFPSPKCLARLAESDLNGFRLSQSKKGTILRLAKAFADGTLTEKKLEAMSEQEVVETLTSIKGVGRWTAEFTLLRGLGRLDVFPAGDLGVVKYFAQDLLGYRGRASEESMRHLAEKWRPYRSLALIYIYAELRRRSLQRKKEAGH